MQTGIYASIAEEDYHQSPGVSKSKLIRFARAPALSQVPQKTTKAMESGSLIHMAVFQPDLLDRAYCPSDLAIFNAKHAAYQQEQERAGDRQLVKRADFERALAIAESAGRNDVVRTLRGGGLLVEQSFYWTDASTGLLCRGRADAISLRHRALFDLKTTTDASPGKFRRDIGEYHYHWQEAMYRMGIEEAGGWQPARFFFLAVEKEPPYLTAAYEVTTRAVQAGLDHVLHNLGLYAECTRRNEWPGYGEEPMLIEPPEYALDPPSTVLAFAYQHRETAA